jgi:2-(1,2-epoxy-1,2-dihydrophenyl)acetyl-CoA isomerase
LTDAATADAPLLQSQHGAVRTLTLNRPLALNSFTTQMHWLLATALDAAAVDTTVRCVVITGAGRGFCAGQDLADPAIAPSQPGAPLPDIGELIERTYRPLINRIRQFPVPVIAAVNGVAAGAGANLALACDLVIAARSASFIQAFSKIGLVPDAGGTWLLPRLVGRARALGLAMLAEKLPAEQAQQWGLIWQCIDDDRFADEVAALALRVAAMPVKALAATRCLMDEAQQLDLDQALAAEAREQRELGRAADCVEGVGAFLAKRAAVFRDR